jgi:hypothetical protein
MCPVSTGGGGGVGAFSKPYTRAGRAEQGGRGAGGAPAPHVRPARALGVPRRRGARGHRATRCPRHLARGPLAPPPLGAPCPPPCCAPAVLAPPPSPRPLAYCQRIDTQRGHQRSAMSTIIQALHKHNAGCSPALYKHSYYIAKCADASSPLCRGSAPSAPTLMPPTRAAGGAGWSPCAAAVPSFRRPLPPGGLPPPWHTRSALPPQPPWSVESHSVAVEPLHTQCRVWRPPQPEPDQPKLKQLAGGSASLCGGCRPTAAARGGRGAPTAWERSRGRCEGASWLPRRTRARRVAGPRHTRPPCVRRCLLTRGEEAMLKCAASARWPG